MREHIVFRIFKNKLVRAGIFVMLLLVGVGALRTVYTVSQKRGIIDQRRVLLTQEEEKNKQLRQQLEEATSTAYIEQIARDSLGLVREGEHVVIVDTSLGTPSAQTQSEQIPSWKLWWELFF